MTGNQDCASVTGRGADGSQTLHRGWAFGRNAGVSWIPRPHGSPDFELGFQHLVQGLERQAGSAILITHLKRLLDFSATVC